MPLRSARFSHRKRADYRSESHAVRPRPYVEGHRRCARQGSSTVDDIGLSVITLAELEYGVAKSSRPATNREALEQFVSPLDVTTFDRRATIAYGKLRATLEKKGQPIGSLDLLIAAHALSLEVR